jgi:hypothetical protein
MNQRLKKSLVQQNIYTCKYGIYKSLTVPKSQKNFFNDNFIIAPPYKYCDVHIISNHSLNIAYNYSSKGFTPVVINIVKPDFNASNLDACEGFKDELMNIRTNFNKTLNIFDLFPVHETATVYAPKVYVIRDDNMQNIHPSLLHKISMITCSLKNNPTLINNNLIPEEYQNLKKLIETIFQTAKLGNNDTIVLNDFGCMTDNYPIEDIIDIINICICKYGHLFKNIIIGIPIKDQSSHGFFNKFNTDLIKPQNYYNEYIIKDKQNHDNLLQQINMSNQLLNSSTKEPIISQTNIN